MARAFGLRERTITFRYALKLAIIPTVVVLGIGVGHMISGAVFAEIVFARPGVGRLIYDAVMTRNYPVVMGGVMLTTGFYVLCTLAADLDRRLARPACPCKPLTRRCRSPPAARRLAEPRPSGARRSDGRARHRARRSPSSSARSSPSVLTAYDPIKARAARPLPAAERRASPRHRPSRPRPLHARALRRAHRARRRADRDQHLLRRRARARHDRRLRAALARFAAAPRLRRAALVSDRDAGAGAGDARRAEPRRRRARRRHRDAARLRAASCARRPCR